MNRKEFYATLLIGLASGMYIGYSKAREKLLEVILKAQFDKEDLSE